MDEIKRILFPDTNLPPAFPLGLGTVNAGLDWDGADAFRMFEHYLDMGGNVIDSARVYSDWVEPEIGRSERVLGDWIRRRGHADDFILISKGGHPQLEHMHTPRMTKAEMDHDLALSLKALGVECIDIYFYHRDDIAQPVGALLEVMEGYVREGKIRYYGCSNWTAPRIRDAYDYAQEHGLRGFIANEMLFNMGQAYMKPLADDTMAAMDADMMQIHRSQNNLAVPYFGLCSGFFHNLDAFGEAAVRDSPYYTPGNLELKRRIDRIRQATGATITQVLLGFFYVQPFPVLPLISAQNLEQLEDAMLAPARIPAPSAYRA